MSSIKTISFQRNAWRNPLFKSIAIEAILTTLSFFFISIIYYQINNIASGILLIILAIYLFVHNKKIFNHYANLLGLFSISWFGTIGLSIMRIHQLQQEWSFETWALLGLTFLFLCCGMLTTFFFKTKSKRKRKKPIPKTTFFTGIVILSSIVLVALLIEFIIRGYLPAFTGNMQSYKDFSVTGIHYFTVSSCLILPLSIVFLHFFRKDLTTKHKIILTLCIIISIAVPIVIVSRQLLILTAIVSTLTFLFFNPKLEIKLIVATVIILTCGWLALSFLRAQDDTYLRSALDMRKEDNVQLMQLYMYTSMNYDNLNTNVGSIEQYSYGNRTLSPLLTVTGIKHLLPENKKLTRINPNYTTYPMIMDSYSDFGPFGVILFSFAIGIICGFFDCTNYKKTIGAVLIRNIIGYCLILSFFYNGFSNTAIWFYIGVLILSQHTIFRNQILPTKRKRSDA